MKNELFKLTTEETKEFQLMWREARQDLPENKFAQGLFLLSRPNGATVTRNQLYMMAINLIIAERIPPTWAYERLELKQPIAEEEEAK